MIVVWPRAHRRPSGAHRSSRLRPDQESDGRHGSQANRSRLRDDGGSRTCRRFPRSRRTPVPTSAVKAASPNSSPTRSATSERPIRLRSRLPSRCHPSPARTTCARWIPTFVRLAQVRARSAGWRSSPTWRAHLRRGSSTRARCTRRSCADEPGSCPICGMALEPRTVTLDEAPNPELVDMTRRFWIGAALGAAGLRPGDERHARSARALGGRDRHAAGELGRSRARHAGRAVGGLAVLRARLGVDRQPARRTCSR